MIEAKEIKDEKKKCCVEGCNNISAWHQVINFKVYRRKMCESHFRRFKGKTYKSQPPIKKFKRRGLGKKCIICNWEGPCDVHRIVPKGPYNLENMMSSCPNCHRLIHFNMMITEPINKPYEWKRKELI